jgi:hypothetical protein
MKRLVVPALIIASALLAASVVTVDTARADAVACGAELLGPGTYVLTSDLSCSGNGLILRDGVTLDLNGHSITGPGASTSTYGLRLPKGSLGGGLAIVENGTVQQFGYGINALDDTSLQADTIRIMKNGIGIQTFFAGAILHNSQINNNVGDGINLDFGRIRLFDSEVSHNGGNGVYAHEAPVQAERSEFSHNGGEGIYEDEWSVFLVDNQANHNGGNGIHIGKNDFNDQFTLLNNTASHNGGHGIVYAPGFLFEHLLIAEGNVAGHNQTEPQCIDIPCLSK